jgi:hypothetical protein
MKVKTGQRVKLLTRVVARDAFFKDDTKPGKTAVTLERGTAVTAAIDEIGGNVVVETTTPEGDGVYVTLAQGEFTGE